KEGRLPGTAPFRVAGFIERTYTHKLDISQSVPGSRFYPIGGTFYRGSVRQRATIRIQSKDETHRQELIAVAGVVGPARADQRVLVDVLFPDGKTRRTVETTTRYTGQFDATVSLLDDHKKLMLGPYRVQAFIFQASELADAQSNVLHVTR